MTPRYRGPTNAEQFVDDVAARRSLGRHDLPVPPQLSMGAIRERFSVLAIGRDEDDKLAMFRFIDGSVAELDHRARWVVIYDDRDAGS